MWPKNDAHWPTALIVIFLFFICYSDNVIKHSDQSVLTVQLSISTPYLLVHNTRVTWPETVNDDI